MNAFAPIATVQTASCCASCFSRITRPRLTWSKSQILHQHLDESEKARIVSLLWQIAYADNQLDKYEDALVLKISDLLHVSRGRVMRLKHDAQQLAV